MADPDKVDTDKVDTDKVDTDKVDTEESTGDLLRGLLRLRRRRVDLLIGVLLLALGFGAVVQVRSARDDGLLASARQEDLVRILDDLSERSERLRDEVTTLTAARERLAGSEGEAAALEEARRRTQVLGVLAGTLPASGEGIELLVQDPERGVRADILLDTLEELRDAGAEAVQIDGTGGEVRVIVSTALLDARDGNGVVVDDVLLRPPYRFRVIGRAATLESAVGIPGGVLDTIANVGGTASVEVPDVVRVTALKEPEPPQYARPAN